MSATIDCGICPAEIAAGLAACPSCGRPVTDADRAVLQVRLEGSDFAAHERGRKVRAGAKWIGALAILFTIAAPVAFAMQSSTADTALASLERFDDADELAPIDGKTYTAGELRKLVRREPIQALVINLVLAGAMGILWAWGRRAPLPAIACALALYIVVQVVNTLLDPTTIFQGIIVKFVALVALGKGFQAALAARAAAARPPG